MNIDLIARQVLMSAYLYYHRNESVLSDAENDANVLLLIEHKDKIPERYLPLLDISFDTDEMTVSTYGCKYTRLVEGGALHWLYKKTGERLPPLGHGYFEFDEINFEDMLL